jgi:hypothetical protein
MRTAKTIDIREITSAWWDSYFASDNQKELAKERLSICEGCPSLQEKFKQIRKLTISVCGECGCPVSKKIFSNKFNACPLGKWKEVDESHTDFFKIKKDKLL